MNLTPEYIREYLDSKFPGKTKLSGGGQELLMQSPFVDDYKYHFSINVYNGLWQDFKAGESGNFIQLYSKLEGVDYRKAEELILIKTLLHVAPTKANIVPASPKFFFEEVAQDFIPLGIESITELQEKSTLRDVWMWLYKRNLFDKTRHYDQYYFASKGDYADRIIIPFRNKDDNLIYFQGRAFGDFQPKYMNPDNSVGIKSSDILYPFDMKADKLVVCEGPLDAISLQLQGINATSTQGSKPSYIQMQIISEFPGEIMVGYDNDDAGNKGFLSFEKIRRSHRMSPLHRVSPPKGYKDWNHADRDWETQR